MSFHDCKSHSIIKPAAATLQVDRDETKGDDRDCSEGAAAGEIAMSSWNPSKPVTALPLQSFNLSYPAGSTYVTPRLLMMNPSRGAGEEQLQDEDMCYMGADGDGSVSDRELDMESRSGCTSWDESEDSTQEGAGSSSEARGTCKSGQQQQQQGDVERHQQMSQRCIDRNTSNCWVPGYKAAGSRLAEILSEEEVLQGSPDLPDSGGAAPAQCSNGSRLLDSSTCTSGGDYAERVSAGGSARERLHVAPELLMALPGSSPERSSPSRDHACRSTGSSSCSSLPTPGQKKPGGWVRGSDGCSWGEVAAAPVGCGDQGTSSPLKQQQQQQSPELPGIDLVQGRDCDQATAGAAAIMPVCEAAEPVGSAVVSHRGGEEGCARQTLPKILVLERGSVSGRFMARNSYSSPSTSTGASGVARSTVSDRVWRSIDAGRASRGSKEACSLSSTPGTRGPASPFSPRPPSWGVDRFKEENDVLVEQLQVGFTGDVVDM
jgi:hypothetical protein